MNDSIKTNLPEKFNEIVKISKDIGFTITCDLYTGSILRTLAASKPNSNFLELGTGTGLSLAWITDGMDEKSQILSIDNDSKLSKIAEDFYSNDKRVKISCQDGSEWINSYAGEKFDFVFADAYPGKIFDRKNLLELIKVGGLYIIDDLTIYPDWSDGHKRKINELIIDMENQTNFQITKLDWSTGLIIATKKY